MDDLRKFVRGSEWVKWDLHVHTPCSIYQHFGGNTEKAWEKFITDLEDLPEEFKVLGINDYVFLEGYKKVIEFREAGRLKNIDLILPVIELRLDKFASLGSDDPWKKVNFHIIFSDKLNADLIERNFLNTIQHKLKFDIDGAEEDFNEIVTHDTLIQLGKKVKEKTAKQINDSDLKTGFNSLTFSYEVIFQKLEASTFRGKFLTAIGKSEWDTMRWDGSPGTKRTVINKANFVFTALEKPENYELQKQKLTAQQVNDKLLDCSDSHHFADSTDKDRIGNCFTWLKANTTFEGLKQVANESSRIYVGNIPPLLKRVHENPTRYIKKLSFQKIEGSKLEEIWFENLEIEVNYGLVAIIGNKGNGKSALTDSIGLVGNTPNHKAFSFLGKKKFRAPIPKNRAESFNAYLTWATETVDEQNLAQDPHPNSIEKVKYIPQGHLEKLCNEDHEDFEDELRNVIFTHIPDAEKYGKTDLEELAKFRTDAIQNEIDQILIIQSQINEKIVELEKKDSQSYLEQIKSSLVQRQKELEAHKNLLPVKIESPNDPETLEKNKEVSSVIENKRKQQSDIERLIDENSTKQRTLNISIDSIEKAKSSLRLLENQAQRTIEDVTSVLDLNGIDIHEILKYEIKLDKIDEKLIELNTQLSTINLTLNGDEDGSLPNQLIKVKDELLILQDTLDEPSKRYQQYLDSVSQWTQSEKELTGSKEHFGSLKYLEGEVEYIEKKLKDDLNLAIQERERVLRVIFVKKNEILDVYKSFYKPITEFLENYGELLNEYEIKLDIENRFVAFEEKFFNPLNAGAKGSFIGINEGREKLIQILEQHEWSTPDGIVGLLNEIVFNLKNDTRDGFNNAKRDVQKQLKGDFSVEEYYNFLFGLEYLGPTYKLKLNNKNIAELSPGERGALLLIFYLALDRNDIPLIIDQPEENLDNQSVYSLLAQFILKAKEKRQIILVTHNPNLAVVCDADQISMLE